MQNRVVEALSWRQFGQCMGIGYSRHHNVYDISITGEGAEGTFVGLPSPVTPFVPDRGAGGLPVNARMGNFIEERARR